MTVIDLFAGMGGWSVACADLGLDELGIEWNDDACATRQTAGFKTLKANVATLDPSEFGPCTGLIASPPCQDFSVAGKGAGREGDRGRLVDEVVRWVDVLRPRWVACEQVPPVLPIWAEFAHRFEQWGYRTWVGLLSAECFGVPQTRERAILMASLDGPVIPPEPTHQAYRHGEPAAPQHGLFGDLLPWVSMAQAVDVDTTVNQWTLTRPATTIMSTARVAAPNDGSRDGLRPVGVRPSLWDNSAVLTVPEGLVLQGFPADMVVHGTKTSQFLQIGNAFCPPVAKAILTRLVGER